MIDIFLNASTFIGAAVLTLLFGFVFIFFFILLLSKVTFWRDERRSNKARTKR